MENLDTYDGIFYDAEHDEHKSDFYDIISSLLNDGGVYTFFNPKGDGVKNHHNIEENIRYESVDIDPPKNPYIDSNIHYVPIVEI